MTELLRSMLVGVRTVALEVTMTSKQLNELDPWMLMATENVVPLAPERVAGACEQSVESDASTHTTPVKVPCVGKTADGTPSKVTNKRKPQVKLRLASLN